MQYSTVANALDGINKAMQRVDKAAGNIAGSDSYDGSRDIIEDIVDLRFGRQMLAANALVLKNEMEMQENIVDLLA